MLLGPIFVGVLVAGLVNDAAAFARCREDIIFYIYKNFWKGEPPRGIIDNLKKAGRQDVGCTNPGYFSNAAAYFDVEDPEYFYVDCGYGKYNTSDGKYYITLKPNGKNAQSAGFYVTEDQGKTYYRSYSESIVRYHIMDRNGVTLLYACSWYGSDKTDEVDVLIKLTKGYCGEDYRLAKKWASEIGAKLTCHYTDTC